ncbi:MAG: beta-ketoacyl-ACP synthase II [Polyangiaceae bacterium]
MKRVVVTGLGLVTPLGVGVAHVWRQLLEGRSGIRAITGFETSDLSARIGGQVPRGTAPGELDLESLFDAKERRRLDDFILYAMAAAQEAIQDSGFEPRSDAERERAGVLFGSGIGGLPAIAETAVKLSEQGPKKVSPFFIPSALINEASGLVSIRFGLRGPCHAVVTACATGANAIGDATRMIQLGDAELMVAGGTEAATCRLALAGFGAMRALSTAFNDDPESACRPWDAARDGFVLAEGAGSVVLEELEHAKARGARIYGEVTGYGVGGDGYHLSAPDPSGNGAARAMTAALARAKIAASDIGYVNAHATSTPVGDPVELVAARRIFGASIGDVSISSTKSATGHLLGAAGAVEAIFSLLALRDQVAPATLNLHTPEDAAGLDLVPLRPKQRAIRHVMSNSFGFGGTNATLVLSRFDA